MKRFLIDVAVAVPAVMVASVIVVFGVEIPMMIRESRRHRS